MTSLEHCVSDRNKSFVVLFLVVARFLVEMTPKSQYVLFCTILIKIHSARVLVIRIMPKLVNGKDEEWGDALWPDV